MANSKDNQYKKIIINVRMIKPMIMANCLSKIHLKRIGRKDGKYKIPKPISEGKWLSPTIDREHSRIDGCMSIVTNKINRKSNRLYVITEYMIAEFEQAAFEYERLHSHLSKKLSKDEIVIIESSVLTGDQKEMLKAKRENEIPLDDQGIRLRRFREYQEKIEPMRIQLDHARNELESKYQIIMANKRQIEALDSYTDIAFLYYSSKIDMRLSWYWQGVLLKYDVPNQLPPIAPKEELDKFKKYQEDRRRALENRIQILERRHDDILSLKTL